MTAFIEQPENVFLRSQPSAMLRVLYYGNKIVELDRYAYQSNEDLKLRNDYMEKKEDAIHEFLNTPLNIDLSTAKVYSMRYLKK